MVREWKDFKDANGLIGHLRKDGSLDFGDCPQRIGMYYVGELYNSEFNFKSYIPMYVLFSYSLNFLETQKGSGIIIRYPDPGPVNPPWTDPSDVSRDQQRSIMVACAFYKEHDILLSLLKQQVKRFGFYQNGDLSSPEDWGIYVRGFNFWIFWPLLWACDLFNLINTIIIVFWKAKDSDNVGDHINHIMVLYLSIRILGTPISWLSWAWFVAFCPVNDGVLRLGSPNPIQGALDWYFREDQEEIPPPMNELYAPLISEFFTFKGMWNRLKMKLNNILRRIYGN